MELVFSLLTAEVPALSDGSYISQAHLEGTISSYLSCFSQRHSTFTEGTISDAEILFARVWKHQLEHWRSRPELGCPDDPFTLSRPSALDSTHATNLLGWRPASETERVVDESAESYREVREAPSSSKITPAKTSSRHAAL